MGSSDQERTSHRSSTYDFIISRSSTDDQYGVWRFDPGAPDLLTRLTLNPEARFSRANRLAAIGGYLLAWSPQQDQSLPVTFPYRLFEFDPGSSDPLAAKGVQEGVWPKKKFWDHREKYSQDPNEYDLLQLIPMTGFVLSFIPGAGRGTYMLWSFDPAHTGDPLPWTPYSHQGAFPTIQSGHELIPTGNYVLDRLPDGNEFRLWSFDPQINPPLAQPTVQAGRWKTVDRRHRLVPIGDQILDWVPEDLSYRLWGFDPGHRDCLYGPLREGRLPQAFTDHTILAGIQPTIPVDAALQHTPGTLDYMRTRIKHVVYYMVESRSFDNVCGWLYEKGEQDVQFVGSGKPFRGASTDFFNYDGERKVHLSKFKDGKLSEDWNLSAIKQDPFHGNPDNLGQMFYEAKRGYEDRARPDMGGFVWNNASGQVMETFSPEQVPILNGLARHFGVSDAWFCSIPGGTDINRAFSVTGASFGKLGTWEGGSAYKYWPTSPHRQSLWKVLWSNGFTDWKIYYAILWEQCIFTCQLYLEGQIPTVDANSKEYVGQLAQLSKNQGQDPQYLATWAQQSHAPSSDYLATLHQFKADAQSGNLPAFSFLEPGWVGPACTSYHAGAGGPDDPHGSTIVPGETALNEIYEALRTGPKWDQTLLIITFDKNGGVYDHVPPPYARKPWPNDVNDGFHFDLMGPRVPTILVSPWIKEQTVFRAEGPAPFDATSFPATLLSWYGIPRARWGLGDRIEHAPTFESVFLETAPRTDAPSLSPPYDKSHPRPKTTGE